jgi:hypothetical protein
MYEYYFNSDIMIHVSYMLLFFFSGLRLKATVDAKKNKPTKGYVQRSKCYYSVYPM